MGGKTIGKPEYRQEKLEWISTLNHYKKFSALPKRFDENGVKTVGGKWIEKQLSTDFKDDQLNHEWLLFEKQFEADLELNYADLMNERWIKHSEELRYFINSEGEQPSPKSDLGKWKQRQHTNYKNKLGMMSLEKYRKIWESLPI